MQNKSGGFTLVEMLVVMGMLAIALSFGIGIQNNLEAYKFQAFTESVGEMVHSAQQFATLQNMHTTLTMGKKDGQITFELRQGINSIKKQLDVPPQVTMKISTDDKKIQFHGDMSPSKAGTLCMKHKGLGEEIHITVRVATGKITFYDDKKC